MEVNVDSIKRAFEENPVGFLTAAGGLFVGLAKIVEVAVESRNSRTYSREIKRRIRKDRTK